MRRNEDSNFKSILAVAVALTLSLSTGAMAAGEHGGHHMKPTTRRTISSSSRLPDRACVDSLYYW